MAGDQDISVHCDGNHVHQGGGHVPVEEEGEDATERGAQRPAVQYCSEKWRMQ